MAAKELLDFGFNEDKNKKEKGKETNNDNSKKKKSPKKPTRKFLLKVSNFPPVAMGAWNWFYPAVSKGMEQNNVELEAGKGEKELSCSLKSYKKKDFLHPPLVLEVTGKRQSFGVDPSWIQDFPGMEGTEQC